MIEEPEQGNHVKPVEPCKESSNFVHLMCHQVGTIEEYQNELVLKRMINR